MASVSLFDVLDDTGKAQAARNLERRRQGISDQLECAFLRKDGSWIWLHDEATYIPEPNATDASACFDLRVPVKMVDESPFKLSQLWAVVAPLMEPLASVGLASLLTTGAVIAWGPEDDFTYSTFTTTRNMIQLASIASIKPITMPGNWASVMK